MRKLNDCYFAPAAIILLLAVLTGCANNNNERPRIAVMAYYVAGDDFQPGSIPVEKLTHIIYSFTEVIDNRMAFVNSSSGEKLHQVVDQKKRNKDLRVMIACGGWGGSGGFSDMASTPENRDIFVRSTIDFINEYRLDGLDIDWEYPGLPGDNNPYRPEDRENFTALMKELRVAMDNTGKDMTLTFAAAGWERFFDHVDLTEVMKYADYMNIMTYDYATGGSAFTAHHTNLGNATLEEIEGTPYYKSIEDGLLESGEGATGFTPRGTDAIVQYCLDLGADPGQLVIGAAFYGRAWKGVPPQNNGLYQPNRGVFPGRTAYAGIRENYEDKNGFTRYWDTVARAPYLYNVADSIFISYDDTVSVRLKTEFAIENRLGGIMFWQLGGDTMEDYGLLDAIYREAISR